MDAVAEWQQPEALDPLRRAVEAGDRFLEPAERAGGEAAEDDAGFPCFAQDLVDAVGPPDAEQADHAAAADVDQVLGQQVGTQVLGPLLAAEERDVAGLAALAGEGAVEADDVVVGVAAGRGQEADLGPFAAAEAEHVLVEQGIARLHREPPTSERDDLTKSCLHAQMLLPLGPDSLVQGSEVRPGALAACTVGRRRMPHAFPAVSGFVKSVPERPQSALWVYNRVYLNTVVYLRDRRVPRLFKLRKPRSSAS